MWRNLNRLTSLFLTILDSQYLYTLINNLTTHSIYMFLKNIEEFFDSSFFYFFRLFVYFIPNILYLHDLITWSINHITCCINRYLPTLWQKHPNTDYRLWILHQCLFPNGNTIQSSPTGNFNKSTDWVVGSVLNVISQGLWGLCVGHPGQHPAGCINCPKL